eukprot:TRINITY_DN20782_c0_g1_i1.p1 TRINITY_DN20782_c0_g1~~TRINITY_DN20782_c0_g1_i1.p1  ORF type:complete len:349 (+),score=118.30 TRINITY_DN20782_c0_g1_i1:165-1211(+)
MSSKDKDRRSERDHHRDSHRDKDRDRDRDKHRDRDTDRDRDRDRERDRDRDRDRERDRDRDRDRHRDRNRDRDKEREREKERDHKRKSTKEDSKPPEPVEELDEFGRVKRAKTKEEVEEERIAKMTSVDQLPGYDAMTPAERVKARLKLQLTQVSSKDSVLKAAASGAAVRWERDDLDSFSKAETLNSGVQTAQTTRQQAMDLMDDEDLAFERQKVYKEGMQSVADLHHAEAIFGYVPKADVNFDLPEDFEVPLYQDLPYGEMPEPSKTNKKSLFFPAKAFVQPQPPTRKTAVELAAERVALLRRQLRPGDVDSAPSPPAPAAATPAAAPAASAAVPSWRQRLAQAKT